MTPQQLLSIFVRLFAILLFVSTLQVLGMASGLQQVNTATPSLAPYLFALIPLISGMVLWCFPQGIALLLLPKREQFSSTLITTQPIALTAAGIVLLGLYTIVSHFPSAVGLFMAMLLKIDHLEYFTTIQFNGVVGLASMLVGFGLISKAWSIAQFIFRSARDSSVD